MRELKRQKLVKLALPTDNRREYLYYKQLKFLENRPGYCLADDPLAESGESQDVHEDDLPLLTRTPVHRRLTRRDTENSEYSENLKQPRLNDTQSKPSEESPQVKVEVMEDWQAGSEAASREPSLDGEEGEDALVKSLTGMIERAVRGQREADAENDSDRMFLLSLLEPLRNVPEERKLGTKIKIMTIINEATQFR